MKSSFIFGIDPSIADTYLLDTERLTHRVGGNTGNLAFSYALRRQLDVIGVVDWSAPADTIRAAGDVAVIPCANQVGSHLDMGGMADKLSEAGVAVVAVGLGAQSGLDFALPDVPEGTRRWLKGMREAAPGPSPNIAVRGEFSADVLKSIGIPDAVPIGCPSLFINPDKHLGRRIKERAAKLDRIAVVSGHFRWRHLSTLESSLAALCETSGGEYVIQSPAEMIALARGEIGSADAVFDACRGFIVPHLDDAGFRRWIAARARAYFDAGQWLESMRRYDLVVGTRIHGVMFALQAGTPGVCIAHDSRTLELCRTMSIPHIHAKDVINGLSRKRLLASLAEVDWDAFDGRRLQLFERYRSFVSANGLAFQSLWMESRR